MVNGAPGSAWSSVLSVGGVEERLLLGTPAADSDRALSADHLFDLASVTKVLTTVCALRLVDAGMLDLDAPVAETRPVGSGDGAEGITARQLLTHASGLPAEGGLWRTGLTGDALRDAVLDSALVSPPGEQHRYSDVGMIALGEIVERVAARPLAAQVADAAVLLGADGLTWRPDPPLAVATEEQPHRGMVRGQVHDELAHALERPAGHAGLFGTADDVATLARMIAAEGEGRTGRVLSVDAVRMMTTPVVTADGYGQALGLRVRERAWMGEADAVGHTGFTGTCFAVVPATGDYGVLLLNRVHPTRRDTDVSAVRSAFLAPLAPQQTAAATQT